MTAARRALTMLVLVPVLLAACAIAPEPVRVGSDECAHCRMLITERRYAAQLLTTRGKAYKFDSIECLVAFVRGAVVAADAVHSLWVTDASNDAEAWLSAEEAVFIRSPALRTPMGGGLAAYADDTHARSARALFGGELVRWAELSEASDEAHDHGS